MEALLIALYDTLNPSVGYNLRPGGNNSSPSAETRKRLSEANKGV